MAHGRTLYRCGCLQSQCRCFSRAGHVDRWLDYPCPKHPDVDVRVAAARNVWQGAAASFAADRDRLLWQGAD